MTKEKKWTGIKKTVGEIQGNCGSNLYTRVYADYGAREVWAVTEASENTWEVYHDKDIKCVAGFNSQFGDTCTMSELESVLYSEE